MKEEREGRRGASVYHVHKDSVEVIRTGLVAHMRVALVVKTHSARAFDDRDDFLAASEDYDVVCGDAVLLAGAREV